MLTRNPNFLFWLTRYLEKLRFYQSGNKLNNKTKKSDFKQTIPFKGRTVEGWAAISFEQAVDAIKEGKESAISLTSADIDNARAKKIADLLKTNKSVTWISFNNNNQIDDEGAKHLAALLKVNKSITSMDLSNASPMR